VVVAVSGLPPLMLALVAHLQARLNADRQAAVRVAADAVASTSRDAVAGVLEDSTMDATAGALLAPANTPSMVAAEEPEQGPGYLIYPDGDDPIGWHVEGQIYKGTPPGNPETGAAVYRFFQADGNLLYVGRTTSFGQRWKEHAASKSWHREIHHMSVVWYADPATAAVVEAKAIREEWPRHNVTHNPKAADLVRYRKPRGAVVSKEPDAVRARTAYRKSLREGHPLSDRALGAMFNRGRTWGGYRIKECDAGPAMVKAADG
jgi:hypothetical protein